MSTQLDILALEPFYGGARRIMLETLIRCSRHRWTLLKLPPRRIERRLLAAAHWFSEQLSRHWVGQVDLLFTSEALNLADLFRFVPGLLHKPSVVYFHSNQLPRSSAKSDGRTDFVNLNTAQAATEIWFNSMFHLRSFLSNATAMIGQQPEIAGQNPMQDIAGKAHLMPPPIDLNALAHARREKIPRDGHTFFIDTRDADISLLNSALGMLARRGGKARLLTVGPIDDLATDYPRTTLPESDEMAQGRALLQSEVFLSAKLDAPCDHHAVRALTAGCWPILPATGVYPELLPESLHSSCLYNGSPDKLVGRLQDVWHMERPRDYQEEQNRILRQFDPIAACRAMDKRLEELVVGHSVGKKGTLR